MSTRQIIKEIESLPEKSKQEIYNYIQRKLSRKDYAVKVLDEIRGIGKGLWDKDAQEYVNELRRDDRF